MKYFTLVKEFCVCKIAQVSASEFPIQKSRQPHQESIRRKTNVQKPLMKIINMKLQMQLSVLLFTIFYFGCDWFYIFFLSFMNNKKLYLVFYISRKSNDRPLQQLVLKQNLLWSNINFPAAKASDGSYYGSSFQR